MRRLLMGGALGVLIISLAACGGSSTAPTREQDTQRQADLYAIGEIQRTFHKALSTKDIELMMSVWAPNATMTVGSGVTYAGREKIRDNWLSSTPFKPTTRWVAESPVYKTRATANGDKGTLFFECHMIDATTHEAVVLSGADTQVARIDGRWLITSFVGATGSLSP